MDLTHGCWIMSNIQVECQDSTTGVELESVWTLTEGREVRRMTTLYDDAGWERADVSKEISGRASNGQVGRTRLRDLRATQA